MPFRVNRGLSALSISSIWDMAGNMVSSTPLRGRPLGVAVSLPPLMISVRDWLCAISYGAEQIFRYAPLSSGLEILRKTLGQHEIAMMQTTSIDQAAGIVSIVNLTTVLAHASGEWIASDWPVCAISETATDGRGANLCSTHALFILVGIG